ncbi:hypothetical protein [Parvibaculum sp.]|uniref:hypothetical protein n=1 Tax=Parvibaculum sp. TaxID=2024848 RepID=UPI001D57A9F9|nr:hypothetical protein [Parvibaculum sp.]MBX3489517.1 hypothetical protein [Parvibaculum sp.]MCW5726527.1 hypothetical protein [Parvibaculum sp.]
MQIGAQIRRQTAIGLGIALIYEAGVAFGINKLTGGDTSSFFVWLVGIQVAAMLLWMKNSVRDWITFVVGRKGIESRVVQALQQAEYPAPWQYVESAADYFRRIADSPDIDPVMRVRAARDEMMVESPRVFNRYQDALRLGIVMDEALRRYADEKGSKHLKQQP